MREAKPAAALRGFLMRELASVPREMADRLVAELGAGFSPDTKAGLPSCPSASAPAPGFPALFSIDFCPPPSPPAPLSVVWQVGALSDAQLHRMHQLFREVKACLELLALIHPFSI